jgi:hypothetical protein
LASTSTAISLCAAYSSRLDLDAFILLHPQFASNPELIRQMRFIRRLLLKQPRDLLTDAIVAYASGEVAPSPIMPLDLFLLVEVKEASSLIIFRERMLDGLDNCAARRDGRFQWVH